MSRTTFGVILFAYFKLSPFLKQIEKSMPKAAPKVLFFDEKSADLRFGVLDHVVGEARGEVYLPPTPLRRGGRCLRATNPSEGSVEEAKPLARAA